MTELLLPKSLPPGLKEPKVTSKILKSDGPFPNNEQLPLLIYRGAFDLVRDDPASQIETVFESNVWCGIWRNGVHTSHHYHSNAHEVLGCYAGSARIQFGGPSGLVVNIQAGDIVIVPAGVAHRNLGCSNNFRIIGAYPRGQQSYDLRRGLPNERPKADETIAGVPLPDSDPVYGAFGPMVSEWKLTSKPRTTITPLAVRESTAASPRESSAAPSRESISAKAASKTEEHKAPVKKKPSKNETAKSFLKPRASESGDQGKLL
jgi:uncharacterized protein YjlB